jgi:filamentous hemagglutinin
MNKNLFRIIFNKRRGQLMAVAETSSSQGKGAVGETTVSGEPAITNSATVALGVLGFSVLCALGAVLWALPTPNAHAQVVAYRQAPSNQQPTILQTANGVPQVNIQTPSAAGVSRNIYSQFDVQSNGVILNNSRTSVQTQQGGWVQGNPWLATGSARVILNEVNSSNPSYLNGYVEVAGQRAEVVIANPSGISVNGGGFINTSKATLTTGSPIVNNGSLDGYRVQGGNISISGNGLDLSTTDYSAILARAVQVNAGIWANELKVVTGANQIDAASLAANTTPITTTIAGTGAVPSYALDVAQIGGMYAGKIHLIGTEQGLGVRSAGTISATGGDFVLQNNGWLTNSGSIRANGNLEIQTLGLTNNQGSIASTANTHVTTTQDVVNNDGLITAGQTLTVQASNITNTTNAEMSGTKTQITASQTLTNRGLIDGVSTQIVADSLGNIGTGRLYGDNLEIQVKTLRNDTETVAGVTTAGTIAARNTLKVQAVNITNREHALIYSDGDMNMTVSDTLNNNSATIEAARDMVLNAKTIHNTNEHFSYEVRLDESQTVSQTDWLDYSVEHMYYRDYTRNVYVPFNTSSDPAQILAGRNMTLNSDTVTNQDSHIILGGGLTYQGNNLVNADVTATKRIHDFGTNHVRVRTPDCDWTGNCNNNVFRWDTSGYDANEYSTVYAPQPVVYKNSGYQTTAVTPGGVSNNALLPNSSMFKTNPSATSKYLVETDPRFANQKTWLGSNYITQYLTLDPTVTQKRLGDGFYEQRLIREQVANLTGRRFLGDYTSDQQEYQALMDSAITYAKAYNLRPGIALSDAQVAQLTSDIVWLVEQTVRLADGSTQKVLVPQVYVKPRADDLQENGALISAKEIDMKLSGDLTNSGTIAGRKVANLSADNIHNFNTLTGESVSVAAQTDLNNVGGSISASNSLHVTAGRDINLQTTTNSSSTDVGAGNFSRTTVDRVAGLYVSGANGANGGIGGTLVASAGRDLVAQGANISNAGSGDTVLSAGKNFQLSSVTTSSSDSDVWSSDNYRKTQQSTEVGSTVSGGGNVQLKAGQALNVRASQVQADQTLSVDAQNVRIESGVSQSSSDQAYKATGSGLLGSTTVASRDTSNSTTDVASNLGGKQIKINAGNDIAVKGSNVVSDNGTTLTAGGNVNIEAATNTSSSTSWRQTSSSGFLSGGGIGVSYGTRMQSTDGKDATTTAAASTVGSINGNVSITAGNQYKQVGSDVLTPTGDISIKAKTVDIQEARETSKQSTEQKFEQTSISAGFTGGIIDSVQTATKALEAAKDSSNTRNRNLNALIAYAKGSDAYEQGKAIEKAYSAEDPSAAAGASGIKLSVGIGTSKSQSNSTSSSDTAAGSTVKAGGNVSIKATGQGEGEGNLTIQGSNVSAAKDVSLSATKDVNILASADTESNRSSNSSSSTSVGVSVGIGQGGAGLSLDLAASRGKGQANSDSTTYNNSHVSAGNAVNITSGADTNVVGGNIKANQVSADVGGNLNVQSLQDKAVSEANQKTTGIALSVPIVGTGGSASFSQSKQNSNSNYASVNEQSGIQAGDGGFQVNVKGNTDLKGATLVGSSDASKNVLTTNTLTTSDINNSMSASASSSGVSVGTNMMDGKYAMGKAIAGNLLNNGSANQSDASTTTSAISAGNITVGGKTTDTSKERLTDSNGKTVSTDTSNTNRTLAKADVAALQKSAQEQQAGNMLVLQTAVAFTDQAFKASFLDQAKMYKKVPVTDDKGNTTIQWQEMTPEEKAKIPPGSRIANNGIFNGDPNDPKAAQDLATQNSSGAADYLVHFPQANTLVAELLVAGYQKFLESGTTSLTNATQQNVDLIKQTGGNITLDGHSRGGMTVGNALTAVQEQGGAGGGKTNVNFFGSAYNAQDAANTVNQLTNGQGQVTSQVHKDDFVGTVLGGNAATGGTTPSGSSTFQEWIKTLGGDSTSHNNYGDGKKIPDGQGGTKSGIDDYWGGAKPVPQVVKPTNQLISLPAGDGK